MDETLILEKGNGDITIKIYKYNITDGLIKEIISSFTPNIVIFNNDYKKYDIYNNVRNIYDLKKVYRGQTYYHFPIHIVNNTILVGDKEEDETLFDGYIVISKRDLRTKYPHIKTEKRVIVDKVAKDELTYTIKDLMSLMNGNVYRCHLTIGKRDMVFYNILADDNIDLKNQIIDKVDFIDEDFDRLIEEALQ